ncbi:cysteine desulfurase NifS [bacterium CG2_30_37_16]|nr:MAG: cysteine desulfurase NifS [bacterium CG2_30_37_16]
MKRIYFDHAATTALDKDVLEKMQPYFSRHFGNASSLHTFGQEARQALDKSRQEIANILNCDPLEIIFTSGGTESDNLAVKGPTLAAFRDKLISKPLHIITTKIEHPAILKTVKQLEKLFGFEVTYTDVDVNGLVNLSQLESEIKDNTILVSVMYANNEVGTIEPIPEISKIIQKYKGKRQKNGSKLPIYFHTDAVQAGGYLDLDVKKLGVDMLSISGHKFYGPKGTGLLYIKKGTKVEAINTGGGHENGLRAGTENIPGIVGLAVALKNAQESGDEIGKKVSSVRDYLIKNLTKKIDGVILTGHPEIRLPNIASFLIERIEGESMLINLDLKGIAVSTGSACSSGSLEPSHVLKALNYPPEKIHGSLRISLGKENTKEEIDYFLEVFPEIVDKLREISAL